MFAKALFAFLALPGTVAFLVPLLLAPRGVIPNLFGLLPMSLGVAMLLRCVRDFYVAGKGTLAPWSPPRHLVTIGLYRFSRNPMYVAVSTILLSWAVVFRSQGLLVYAVCVMVAFHLRVIFAEEPWLAREFGEEWDRYRAAVPRWLI
jgi:protein-S-isoprenylcysteine O-methyltransferase Ste14